LFAPAEAARDFTTDRFDATHVSQVSFSMNIEEGAKKHRPHANVDIIVLHDSVFFIRHNREDPFSIDYRFAQMWNSVLRSNPAYHIRGNRDYMPNLFRNYDLPGPGVVGRPVVNIRVRGATMYRGVAYFAKDTNPQRAKLFSQRRPGQLAYASHGPQEGGGDYMLPDATPNQARPVTPLTEEEDPIERLRPVRPPQLIRGYAPVPKQYAKK
jgi:hypothetical protein